MVWIPAENCSFTIHTSHMTSHHWHCNSRSHSGRVSVVKVTIVSNIGCFSSDIGTVQKSSGMIPAGEKVEWNEHRQFQNSSVSPPKDVHPLSKVGQRGQRLVERTSRFLVFLPIEELHATNLTFYQVITKAYIQSIIYTLTHIISYNGAWSFKQDILSNHGNYFLICCQIIQDLTWKWKQWSYQMMPQGI